METSSGMGKQFPRLVFRSLSHDLPGGLVNVLAAVFLSHVEIELNCEPFDIFL